MPADEEDMCTGEYDAQQLSELPDSIRHPKPDPFFFFHPAPMRPAEVEFYTKKLARYQSRKRRTEPAVSEPAVSKPRKGWYTIKWHWHKRPDELGASVKSIKKESTRDLDKLIDSSDVVIQVLDARDPLGTRCYHLEKHMKENRKHKHMVLFLNKCDLIPAIVVEGWIRLLSKEYHTLAFDARRNKTFGEESLLSMLGQFVLSKNDMQPISVCFVGYPNVGKSSVINCFRTKNVSEVAPILGETKEWQYIALTERIFLIDCPGLYHNSDSEKDIDRKSLVHVHITNLQEALEVTGEVLKHVRKDILQWQYKVEDWVDEYDFLIQHCRITGKLLMDGEPDLMTAAKMILYHFQRGKISFYVPPPGQDEGNAKKSNLPDVSGKQV